MRIKKFKVRHFYSAYDSNPRSTEYAYLVPISKMNDIKTKALTAIQNDDSKQLSILLHQEFVFAKIVARYRTVSTHCSDARRIQSDIDDYEEHPVSPVHEALFIYYPLSFLMLYLKTECKPKLREILLNFSNLDLWKADLSEIDFSLATFFNTNLSQAKGITQENLNQCINYDLAKLPNNRSQLWSEKKRSKVLDDLSKLLDYGRYLTRLSDPTAVEKGKRVCTHACNLINLILKTPKHDHVFQKNFLQALHQYDKEFEQLRHPRYHLIKKIIANIALFILGSGVLYAAALAINYAVHGRILFFSRTESKTRLDQVEEDMVKPAM